MSDLRTEILYDEDREQIIYPASEATSLQPGSASKIRLMAERDARGENIHHPEDFVCEDIKLKLQE